MEFSRLEYWSGLPFPSPGDLPNPGIEPRSPTLHADSLPAEPLGKPNYLHDIHSIKGKTRRTEIIFSVLRGWGGAKELSPKGLEGKFGVMKMFSVLIVEATA